MLKMSIVLVFLLAALPAAAVVQYDQDVTPDVIFGDGNDNGHFTVSTNAGPEGDTIELGLRAKVRFNENGLPENTFNEFFPGEYYFSAGVGTGQTGITPTWAFEWTVNTDATGMDRYKVGNFTYELGLDFDPGPGTNYVVFDPITVDHADHAMGTNLTANGDGVVAADATEYLSFLSLYNVAQQSWRYSWFDFNGTFDPNEVGIYDIYLKAFAAGTEIAHTHIQVHASYGDPVANEDANWGEIKALFR